MRPPSDLVHPPLAPLPPRGPSPRWYVVGQGGGWLGRFSLPIWQHLMSGAERHPSGADLGPDELLGTSVSAIHAALASQGDLDVAEDFWGDLDDSFTLDGIRGFTSLSLRAGIWSMAPLHAKLEEMVHLDRCAVPVRVGVVTRDPFVYYSLGAAEARGDTQWRRWVAASCAIAAVFEPVDCRIEGRRVVGSDGGHLFSCPWILDEVRAGDRLDLLLHNPLTANHEPPASCGVPLVDSIRWAVWAHTKTGHWEVMRRAWSLAEAGVDVRLWPPEHALGDMLDARAATLDERHLAGVRRVADGPVRLLA